MEQQIKIEEALTDAIKKLDKGLLRQVKVKSFELSNLGVLCACASCS